MDKVKKLLVLLMCSVFALSATSCGEKKEKATDAQVDIKQMQSICELATLECFYHNTAKLTKDKTVWWWDTSTKLWIEYTGTAKIGVDFSEVKIDIQDEVVNITMPNAKVLSCNVDETSLNDDSFYSSSEGWGAEEVTADMETEAIQTAQEGMKETAEKDSGTLIQAKQRTQELLKNYVNNLGESLGKTYSVNWVDVATETTAETTSEAADNK